MDSLIYIVFTVAMLSLTASLCAAAALLFRRIALRGREWCMRAVWAAVLLCAVIPLRFGIPPIVIEADSAKNILDGYVFGAADLTTDVAEESAASENQSGGRTNPEVGADSADTSVAPRSDTLSKQLANLISDVLGALPVILFAVWLCGAAAVVTISAYRGRSLNRALSLLSYEIEDGALYDEFCSLCIKLNIKRDVRLFVIDGDIDISPFTKGVWRPRIYIPSRFCAQGYEIGRIRLTLTHELCHIRRFDMIGKLAIRAVRAVHWFNPFLRLALRVMTEDIELGCDAAVMRLYGAAERPQYFEILLDEASRSYENSGGGLSISFPFRINAREFILRRYENMKNIRFSLKHTLSVILCCTLMLASSAFVMSSCGIEGGGSPASIAANVELPSYIDDAIRAYYGVTDSAKLTNEMLEGVYSIKILKSIGYENEYLAVSEDGALMVNDNVINDGVLLDVYINGSGFGGALERECKKDRFEGQVLESFAAFDDEQTEEQKDILRKLMAFYVLKDPDAPKLTGVGVYEMVTTFPQTADGTAMYIYDPSASPRENALIIGYWLSNGLCDKKFADSDTLALASLSALPNLKYVIYSDDLTVTGCPCDTLVFDTEKQEVIIPEDAPQYIENVG